MNIFVLNTGRCGSTTFIEACRHIENFTCSHESRTRYLGDQRFEYPDNHIEADNRLSWVLGRLDSRFGKNALYVHLTRDDQETASSFVKRYADGIIYAYRTGILQNLPESSDRMSVTLDYCETVNSNIELFLKDKPNIIRFELANAQRDFRKFWIAVGAEGDIETALAEFNSNHNATGQSGPLRKVQESLFRRYLNKSARIIKGFPEFIRNI